MLPSRRMAPGWRNLLAGALVELLRERILAHLGRLSTAARRKATDTPGELDTFLQRAVWARPWEPAAEWDHGPLPRSVWRELRADLVRTWSGVVTYRKSCGACRKTGRHECTGHVRGGWRRRLGNLVQCSAFYVEYRACNGDLRHRPARCGSLFCQRCMRRERVRQQLIVRRVLRDFRHPARMVTLTVPSWPRVTGMRAELMRAFRRLRNRKGGLWQRAVRSAVAVFEHEQSEHGAHVHLHIAVDSPFLPRNELLVDWQIANGCKCKRSGTGNPQLCGYTAWTIDNHGKPAHDRFAWAIAHPECPGRYGGMPSPAGFDIRIGYGGIERELAKYLSKGFLESSRFTDPKELADVLREFWGTVRVLRCGAAQKLKAEDKPECPVHDVCGTPCWERIGLVAWAVVAEQRNRAPP